MKDACRTNRYLSTEELSHRLMANALTPRPKPMNEAERMAHDLKIGDRVAILVLCLVAASCAYLLWQSW